MVHALLDSVVSQVTRACASQALSPLAWESLVRQAVARHDDDTLQGDIAGQDIAAAIVELFQLEQSSSASPPTNEVYSPITISYLRHGLGLFDGSSSKFTSPPLTQAAFVISAVLKAYSEVKDERRGLSPATVACIIREVNSAVDQFKPVRLFNAATSQQDLLTVLVQLLRCVSQASVATPSPRYSSELLELATRLLSSPDFVRATEDKIEATTMKAQAAAAVRNCLESMRNLKGRSVARDAGEALAQRLGERLSALNATAPIAATIDVRVNLDEDAAKKADSDAIALVQDLLYNAFTDIGSSCTQVASARIAAFVSFRRRESKQRGSTPSRAAEVAIFELLLVVTAELRHGKGTSSSFKHEAFAYSRFPELLAAALSLDPVHQNDNVAAIKAGAENFASFLRSGDMDLDDRQAPPEVLLKTIGALCRFDLLSTDFAAALLEIEDRSSLLRPSTDDLMTRLGSGEIHNIKEAMTMAKQEPFFCRLLVDGLRQTVEGSASSLNLQQLALLIELLVREPAIVEAVFCHARPYEILSPFRESLDALDKTFDSFGDGTPLEAFGKVLLCLQIILERHQLLDDVARHLGSSSSFFSKWMPSKAAVYPLEELSQASKAAVDDWIEGLFGEGISDELMSSTKPQTLLYVAPTICKQALAACHAGVIDDDTLWNSLSFFLQDLLSFTLPGVLLWSIDEILRTSPGAAQTRMLKILNKFLFPESQSLPKLVLEIVAPRLFELDVRLASSKATTVIDRKALQQAVKPFLSRHGTQDTESTSSSARLTWISRYNASVQQFLTKELPNFEAERHFAATIRHARIDPLKEMHRLVSIVVEHNTATKDQNERLSRLRRLTSSLMAQPCRSHHRFPDLLRWLATDVPRVVIRAAVVADLDMQILHTYVDVTLTCVEQAIKVSQLLGDSDSARTLVLELVKSGVQTHDMLQAGAKHDKRKTDDWLRVRAHFFDSFSQSQVFLEIEPKLRTLLLLSS
ncbi:hypothetical protein OIO90_005642 [Microbotryomycetes sp. JL221]|nr:hypothetical protein OIO90_005642 [Microbotryomycetes sp. JL221]